MVSYELLWATDLARVLFKANAVALNAKRCLDQSAPYKLF